MRQKFKLGKKRIDKLCKQFGLTLQFQHSHSDINTVGYYCKGQDFAIDIEFTKRNILCWTSTGTIETISHNQFYKVYQIISEAQKYENC